jgi:hypothetical protein
MQGCHIRHMSLRFGGTTQFARLSATTPLTTSGAPGRCGLFQNRRGCASVDTVPGSSSVHSGLSVCGEGGDFAIAAHWIHTEIRGRTMEAVEAH